MKRVVVLVFFVFLILLTAGMGFYAYKRSPEVTDYGTTTLWYNAMDAQWVYEVKKGSFVEVKDILFMPDSVDILVPHKMSYLKLKNKEQYTYCFGEYESQEELAQVVHRKEYELIFWMLVLLSVLFLSCVVLAEED